METKRVGAGFGVIIEKDGKILLGCRHEDPDKADSAFRSCGDWTLPGGELDFGETFEEGAIREVKEETGIDIEDPEVISVHNNKNEHAHFVTLTLKVDKWEGEPKVMEPDEITKWEWFLVDHLPDPLYFPTKAALEVYKEGKFYIKGN